MAGAPTAIGTNTLTSISRQYVMPTVVDNFYNSNALLFRINQSKRFIRGGTQIEVPLMYAGFTTGGAYEGYEPLSTSPQDTIKNGVWDWRQYYQTVAIDGRTLLKADSPEAIANLIKLQFAQAEMEMAENLGTDLYGTNTVGAGKALDGLGLIVSNSDYAGIPVSGNSWWSVTNNATAITSASTDALVENTLLAAWQTASEGGRHPTILVSSDAGYARYWTTANSKMQVNFNPSAYDEALYAGGFSNLLFQGAPWVVDSHAAANNVYMLNEDYIYWVVSPRGDMVLTDFQEAINQDAQVAKMLFAGNIICTNRQRQIRLTSFNNS